jgi:hypothetical protein
MIRLSTDGVLSGHIPALADCHRLIRNYRVSGYRQKELLQLMGGFLYD